MSATTTLPAPFQAPFAELVRLLRELATSAAKTSVAGDAKALSQLANGLADAWLPKADGKPQHPTAGPDKVLTPTPCPAETTPPAPWSYAVFAAKAATAGGITGWDKATDADKALTYGVYVATRLAGGVPNGAAFLALTADVRSRLLQLHDDKAREVANGVLSPAPEAKPEPVATEPKHDRPTCNATKPDGTPCRNSRMAGSNYCHLASHQEQGRATPPVAEAAETQKPAAALSPVPSGTVVIADGKGGYRMPTKADAKALIALLAQLS